MSNNLLQTSLESLRQQFQLSADRYIGLRCVLLHVDAEHRERLGDEPPFTMVLSKQLTAGPQWVFKGRDGQPHAEYRRVYYLGDAQAIRKFGQLARDAAAILARLPAESVGDFNSDILQQSDDVLWICALFDLAWKKLKELPLQAERFCWWPHFEGPHVKAAQIHIRRHHYYGTNITKARIGLEYQTWRKGYPNYYGGELPDVLMGSVYVIDALLSKFRPPLWSITYTLMELADLLRLGDGRTVKARYGEHLVKINRQTWRIDINAVLPPHNKKLKPA